MRGGGLFLSGSKSSEHRILLSSTKSIKTCYVKVERRNSIEKSGDARLYGGITAHPKHAADASWGSGATAHGVSRRVKVSSSPMREAALVRSRRGPPQPGL